MATPAVSYTTPKQRRLLRDLMKVCKRHNVTLQSDADNLVVGRMTLTNITAKVAVVQDPRGPSFGGEFVKL